MIRVYLKYFFFVLIGLFLQSVIVKTGMFTPDLLLVIVIALAFSLQNVAGVMLAFFLGLLCDLASGVYIGPFAAAYVCTFCFAGMVSRRVFADRLFAIMGVTFVSCLIKSLVFCSFILYFIPTATSTLLNFKIFIVEAVLTSLVSPIVFRIFIGRLFAKSHNRNASSSLTFSRATK